MALPKDILKENKGLSDWCILSMYRGSIAHGMYVPKSDPNSIDDKDVMAVCVPPIDHYFGLKQYGSRGTEEIMRGEWDIVIYELKKMISMLSVGNPNVLAMLWLNDKHYMKITEAGQLLLDNRELFVGKHVYRSFTGYAHSQFDKMTKFSFEGYMGTKRKQLVKKFGYDTKNAAHLIRLLRMGNEFLVNGELQVERRDAKQLLAIKRGEWTLEEVKERASRLFELSEKAYIKSDLPEGVDMDKINELCVEIIKKHLDKDKPIKVTDCTEGAPPSYYGE